MVKLLDKLRQNHIESGFACFTLPLDDAKALNGMFKARYAPSKTEGSRNNVREQIESSSNSLWAPEIYLFVEGLGGLDQVYVKYDFDSNDANRVKYLVCPAEDKEQYMSSFYQFPGDDFLDIEKHFGQK